MQCRLSETVGLELFLSDCHVLSNLQVCPGETSGSSKAPHGLHYALCCCFLKLQCRQVDRVPFPSDAICPYLFSQLAASTSFAVGLCDGLLQTLCWSGLLSSQMQKKKYIHCIIYFFFSQALHSKEAQPNRKWYLSTLSPLEQMSKCWCFQQSRSFDFSTSCTALTKLLLLRNWYAEF